MHFSPEDRGTPSESVDLPRRPRAPRGYQANRGVREHSHGDSACHDRFFIGGEGVAPTHRGQKLMTVVVLSGIYNDTQ